MTRRRWIADEVSGDRAFLTGQNALHLARVLRAQPGQQYEIAAGESVRIGIVISASEERVEFELGHEVEQSHTTPIILLLAVFKFDRMEWAIEKVTELGVAIIIPVLARRTESHLAKAAEKRTDRWRRIAHEAAQQSRAPRTPEIQNPVKLSDALSTGAGIRIVLAEAEREKTLKQILGTSPLQSVALAVGPEGGWTEEEIALFAKSGWISASLGPRILRAETAAMASVSVVVSELH